eukprot:Skav204183  [mRNA]  locus=scaffold1955:7928:11324:+ [translate_table: standard]
MSRRVVAKDIMAATAQSKAPARRDVEGAPMSKKAKRRARAKEAPSRSSWAAAADAPAPSAAPAKGSKRNFDVTQAMLPKDGGDGKELRPVAANPPPPEGPKLPKQRPLESLKDYNRRLQQAVKSKLEARRGQVQGLDHWRLVVV